MPAITVSIANMDREKKQTIAKEFTETISRVTGIPKESFFVFFDEKSLDQISVGGVLLSDQMENVKLKD